MTRLRLVVSTAVARTCNTKSRTDDARARTSKRAEDDTWSPNRTENRCNGYTLITITTRCSASRITAASYEALCNTAERLQRPRGASVGPRVSRGEKEAHGDCSGITCGETRERERGEVSARERERYGRGSEVTRVRWETSPFPPPKRTASIQWK